jgi:hypothetical protein
MVFEDMRTVLNGLWERLPGQQDERVSAVKRDLASLHAGYAKLAQGACIDYSLLTSRFAYVYCYVTSHADVIYQLVRDTPALAALMASDPLRVTCVGGGPGSDFIGLLKYMRLEGLTTSTACQVLDRERGWGDCWSDVFLQLRLPFRFGTNFQPVDVCVPADWRDMGGLVQADLVTMIYFLSEVYGSREAATPCFRHIMSTMRPGALLLYVDNEDSRFTQWFDGMAGDEGLEVLAGAACHMQMSFKGDETEEKSELHPYLEWLGSRLS